jgi:Holliday junction resolvasome RuvABC ATP-dependent DNA helicase subunit
MWAMPTTETELLRARARELRRLAARLHARPLSDVVAAAGDDTWRGPTADRAVGLLRADERRLDHAGDDLLRHAVHLERRADELDVLAVAARP